MFWSPLWCPLNIRKVVLPYTKQPFELHKFDIIYTHMIVFKIIKFNRNVQPHLWKILAKMLEKIKMILRFLSYFLRKRRKYNIFINFHKTFKRNRFQSIWHSASIHKHFNHTFHLYLNIRLQKMLHFQRFFSRLVPRPVVNIRSVFSTWH